ncbi:MAG: MarR family transcriptional regulator [Candidatus Bathyarchaeota archaeon]|nr:MarR family transcriptional regulator [Candidatus Bathyarchaeota archaeon]
MIAVTALAGYEYIKQIRLAHKEYLKAKDFIEDIVLSFDRELKRQSAKFDTMVSKVEGSYSTADVSYRKAESVENKIEPLQYQVESLAESYQALSATINQNLSESTQNSTTILSGLTGLEAKLKDIEANQEALKTRIATFEEQMQKLAAAPPVQVEAKEIVLPPIPIKRDKALAALTDTEIQVLEMLSKEGPKTAPEIKERVHLSREHTARLMKKLYEDGYLEREAGKIPFRYSIKKEMEALLQKAEGPAAS